MTRSYQSLEEFLNCPKFGDGPGLERSRVAIAPLMELPWWQKISAIKVVGSNGKGSVARAAAKILSVKGFRTGLYISPHIERIEERISIDGDLITAQDLGQSLAWARGRLSAVAKAFPGQAVSAFELISWAAFHYFASQDVNALVLEAGLGGRFDPTRLLPGRICVLTALELEHRAILGHSLEEIAQEKAAITPPDGLLIHPEFAQHLEAVLHQDNRACHRLGADDFLSACPPSTGAGRYRTLASRLAAAACWQWLKQIDHPDAQDQVSFCQSVRDLLKDHPWTGQLRQISTDPSIWIDCAHTYHALQASLEDLRKIVTGKIVVLIACAKDKNATDILTLVQDQADQVILTSALGHLADAPSLASGPNIIREENVAHAIDLAITIAQQHTATLLVCGNTALVGTFLREGNIRS